MKPEHQHKPNPFKVRNSNTFIQAKNTGAFFGATQEPVQKKETPTNDGEQDTPLLGDNIQLKSSATGIEDDNPYNSNAPLVGLNETPVQQKKTTNKSNKLPSAIQTKMENAFGTDFSDVNIHKNSGKAKDMGALAYAQGTDVHFAPGQFKLDKPGQQLIGHELAHVVQQKEGRVKATKQMKSNGVAINDDPALEREADVMGEKAARGESMQMKSQALGLRRSLGKQNSGRGATLQMKPETDYGEFKTKTYKKVSDYGAEIELEFHPNKKVDADKVGLTQTIKAFSGGNNDSFSPTRVNRQTTDGTYIDRVDKRNNPIYGGQQLGAKDEIDKTKNSGGNFKLGTKKADGTWNPAYLYDQPRRGGRNNKNSGQIFETAALALEGKQQDMYYGSVEWGWEIDGTGTYKLLPLKAISKGDMPSASFLAAAKKWNAATSLGTIKTTGNPTQVYDSKYKKAFTLAKGSEVTLDFSYMHKDDSYNGGTDVATGRKGIIKTSDLEDVKDGDATADLPIPWKGTIDMPAAQGSLAGLRIAKSRSSTLLADLPVGTSLTVLNDSSDWLKVHMDPNQTGIVLNSQGRSNIDAANLLRGYVSKELVKK